MLNTISAKAKRTVSLFLKQYFSASLVQHIRKLKFKFSSNASSEFMFEPKVNKVLGEELRTSVEWKMATDLASPSGELYIKWSTISGAHKWHHYFPIYEKVFSELKFKPIKILEIGVYKGASLKLWREYFHKDSIIVGIDINESCKEYAMPEANLHVRIGSQEDESFLSSIIDEFGDFDLIIDDGSHIVSHMIESFNYLYLKGLKSEGIYFAEDIHTNYWLSHRDRHFSFIDFSKHLVDLMHFHYTIGDSEYYYRLGAKTRMNSIRVPKITPLVDEIRFYDSIVVFYKKSRELPVSEHLHT
ncbi:hypothetical protein ACSX1A_07560 [Pontibacter sp. MBLB2868]|uniref:hypothetical protein n=1 Tax=Pontibacter sp. MBLB2868 TaxID=3451555 RepID=UPI003F7527E9